MRVIPQYLHRFIHDWFQRGLHYFTDGVFQRIADRFGELRFLGDVDAVAELVKVAVSVTPIPIAEVGAALHRFGDPSEDFII